VVKETTNRPGGWGREGVVFADSDGIDPPQSGGKGAATGDGKDAGVAGAEVVKEGNEFGVRSKVIVESRHEVGLIKKVEFEEVEITGCDEAIESRKERKVVVASIGSIPESNLETQLMKRLGKLDKPSFAPAVVEKNMGDVETVLFDEFSLIENAGRRGEVAKSVPAAPVVDGWFERMRLGSGTRDCGNGTVVTAGQTQEVRESRTPGLPTKGGGRHEDIVQCGYGDKATGDETTGDGDGSGITH